MAGGPPRSLFRLPRSDLHKRMLASSIRHSGEQTIATSLPDSAPLANPELAVPDLPYEREHHFPTALNCPGRAIGRAETRSTPGVPVRCSGTWVTPRRVESPLCEPEGLGVGIAKPPGT
jgi:hypothetical protein